MTFAATSEDYHGGQRQGAMATKKKKRHSRVEIATKLARANELATRGKLQSEIARTLGVSVMTLHRWRTALPGPQRTLRGSPEMTEPDRTRDAGDRITELQLENSRLRRLVTDLLLEKLKLEEAAQGQKRPGDGARRASR
jgi:putative transposase